MANGDITVTIGISGTMTTSGTAIRTIAESTTFSSIAAVFEREIDATTSLTTLFTISATPGGSVLKSTAFNCLFVTNLNGTNFVTIGCIDDSAKATYYKIAAGESLLLMDGQIDVNVTGAVAGTLTDIDTVNVKADTGTCRIQVLAF